MLQSPPTRTKTQANIRLTELYWMVTGCKDSKPLLEIIATSIDRAKHIFDI
jgi:hypothetical protein